MLHKTRNRTQRTMLTNALRANLAGHGIVSAQGTAGRTAIKALHEDQANLPVLARFPLHGLVAKLRSIQGGDRGVRGGNPQVASNQRDEPAAGDDPRHRPDHGERDSRECARRVVYAVQSQIRGLAGWISQTRQVHRSCREYEEVTVTATSP